MKVFGKKVIAPSKMYGIVNDAIKSEIGRMNISETEKSQYLGRVENLPTGFLKIGKYQSDLKKLLTDISRSGGNVNRINQEIEEKTK